MRSAPCAAAGTLSISGVYGGAIDPLPMMELFDKGVQIRMGQTHVKRWVDEIMPLLLDGDPLGTEELATHRLPLEGAPRDYELFQRKEDGAIKVVLQPSLCRPTCRPVTSDARAEPARADDGADKRRLCAVSPARA
jgi:hypothetical protein